ncbi:MAG: dihydrolipoyl dehydrogenase [Gammaproteobacteria bacterium]|nr:MAG: dihydrolipoyl dehydrogenase [Gammaproteobacteria bacterium]
MSRVDLTIPDIGNFTDVSVVDVLVKPGDVIAIDSPLVTLETDKASMDVPATAAGTIAEVSLKRGDKVSKGSLIARVDASAAAASVGSPAAAATSAPAAPPAPAARRETAGDTARMPSPGSGPDDRASQEFNRSTQLLVLGAGPGGYTAAFRAADLGLKVTLVERWQELGGVCLNVGCIPSKALLHAAKVIEDAEEMGARGIAFGAPQLDLQRLRAWKSSVVAKLTGGLKVLVKQRKVDVVRGTGRFVGPNVLEVMGTSGSQRIHFDQCIIAAGSEPVRLAGLPDDPRILDSTDALELPSFSGGLLVVGGGIIGLEMACVFDALGVRVSVVELTPQLMPGCDPDLVRPLERRIRSRYEQILLGTRVAGIERDPGGLRVSFTGDNAPSPQIFGRVLVAVGRTPNGHTLGAELAGVKVSERGFIPVDRQMRTNVPHIFAIGDIAAPPLLAHKAMHEGKVASEVAAGHKRAFDVRTIPSVAYTDPEIAWVGLTETDARANGTAFRKGAFPWVANGRSLSLGRDEGFTKLLFDPDNHRVLGGGVVGTNAGELISEIALAVETGCDAADIGLTIHPHPTLSETVAGAAEAVEGTLTDLYLPRK